MKTVELGTTGQQVSAIALGCMSLTQGSKAESLATRWARRSIVTIGMN